LFTSWFVLAEQGGRSVDSRRGSAVAVLSLCVSIKWARHATAVTRK